jgi:hypothetical protein
MNDNTPWVLRWTIRLLSVLLLFLFVWLQGFLIGDIDDMEGPDLQAVENKYVGPELLRSERELTQQKKELERAISRQQEIKANRREAMSVAQQTWNQIVQEHRRELDAGRQPTKELSSTLAETQERYLRATATVEEANNEVGELQQRQHALIIEEESLAGSLTDRRDNARRAYTRLWDAHRWRVAAVKLAFVVPIFLLSSWLVWKRSNAIFRPMILALLLSSFYWLGVVMHQHFPAEYFKYIGILAAITIVVAFLLHALRTAAKPQDDILLRRRREAYHSSRCPECAYPIPQEKGGAMSCASCGASLFSECPDCGKIRHHLLPHCRHCGAETERWRTLGRPVPEP